METGEIWTEIFASPPAAAGGAPRRYCNFCSYTFEFSLFCFYTFEFRTPGPLAVSRSRSYFSAPGTMVTHTAAKRESVYTLRWLINFLRLPRTVLETEGPGASQPVSNIQLETRAKSSAEFPKAGFQDSIPHCIYQEGSGGKQGDTRPRLVGSMGSRGGKSDPRFFPLSAPSGGQLSPWSYTFSTRTL